MENVAERPTVIRCPVCGAVAGDYVIRPVDGLLEDHRAGTRDKPDSLVDSDTEARIFLVDIEENERRVLGVRDGLVGVHRYAEHSRSMGLLRFACYTPTRFLWSRTLGRPMPADPCGFTWSVPDFVKSSLSEGESDDFLSRPSLDKHEEEEDDNEYAGTEDLPF